MIAPLAALLRLHEINVEAQERGNQVIDRGEVRRLLQAITPELHDRYIKLYRLHGADAILPMRRSACTGCHTRQPAMLAQLDDCIYICEHCGRLMYYRDDAYELYVG